MAVFTRITHDELNAWLAGRPCGSLQSFEGISSGIENTNYFVNTSNGRYVLTIFEKLQAHELPFYLGLMGHLAHKGLPVPGPVADESGALFSMLKNKPATLVNCLHGRSVDHPNPAQCAAIGEFLARAHLAVGDFNGQLPNPRGLSWVQEATGHLVRHAPEEVLALLSDEVAHQSRVAASDAYSKLPKGAVHADLFRDNALMDGDDLGGVIDFYFAGVDTFLFDLAVTANDWCIDLDTGALNPERTSALLNGYQMHRALETHEQALWQDMLRSAALRFWTSRLVDYYMPRDAEVLTVKDPSHFERVLKARRAGCPACLI
ncbi:MAG TPA: homoserine kinase [Limnobacter sp.]|uniref:homoserine kinase n=1 Tax=Limnobacter sp. TaxID=2003368 RepID=UPI002EDA1B50